MSTKQPVVPNEYERRLAGLNLDRKVMVVVDDRPRDVSIVEAVVRARPDEARNALFIMEQEQLDGLCAECGRINNPMHGVRGVPEFCACDYSADIDFAPVSAVQGKTSVEFAFRGDGRDGPYTYRDPRDEPQLHLTIRTPGPIGQANWMPGLTFVDDHIQSLSTSLNPRKVNVDALKVAAEAIAKEFDAMAVEKWPDRAAEVSWLNQLPSGSILIPN